MDASSLVDAWRRWVAAEGERRKLPKLARVADGLAAATAALRSADWNPDPSAVARASGDDDA